MADATKYSPPILPPSTRQGRLIGLAMAASALAVAIMVGSRLLNLEDWRYPLALAASTGFVLVALLAGATGSPYGRLVLAALVFCWLGDACGPGNFLLGTMAFLVAQLFFIAALRIQPWSPRATVLAAVPLGILSALSLARLWPHIPGGERGVILVYTLALTLMAACAIGAAGRSWILPAAGLIFYISDFFVGQWRYLGGSWNGYVCYPLYYTACLLFAFGVYHLNRHPDRPGPRGFPPQ